MIVFDPEKNFGLKMNTHWIINFRRFISVAATIKVYDFMVQIRSSIQGSVFQSSVSIVQVGLR